MIRPDVNAHLVSRPLPFFVAAFFMLLVLLTPPSTEAATQVSGVIAEDTVWEIEASPYVVSGVLRVTNDARLEIPAGIAVQFEPEAGLDIEQGSLIAVGEDGGPVVFTSVADNVGNQAAPGDWGHLHFGPGTRAGTVLSHVEVRYGRGVSVHGAAPEFNDLHVAHCAGPAIAMDLAASPTGVRLSAAGNAIDGIAVPAGLIESNVKWSLQGIPYVVQEGNVRIGRARFGLAPARLDLYTGRQGTLTVSLPEPAPAGGLPITIETNAPAVAGVSASLLVPEGLFDGGIPVEGLSEGVATVTINAPTMRLQLQGCR